MWLVLALELSMVSMVEMTWGSPGHKCGGRCAFEAGGEVPHMFWKRVREREMWSSASKVDAALGAEVNWTRHSRAAPKRNVTGCPKARRVLA